MEKVNPIRVRTIRIFDGKDEKIQTKNAYAIGHINKKIYVAIMYREEDEKGRVIYIKQVHTLKTSKDEEVQFVEDEKVDEVFSKIQFY